MKATLQDIANKAGVSTATVSRTLNNRSGVHPDTRAEILQIAAELGYVTNTMVPSGTATLGFVSYKRAPQVVSASENLLLEGVDSEARRHGYHVITTYIDDMLMNNATSLPIIRDKKIDGLLLAGPALSTSFIIELYESGIPLILIDNLIEDFPIDAVISDNIGGTYAATRHLIRTNQLERLIFFSGPSHWLSSRERLQGYEKALDEVNQPSQVIYMSDTTVDAGYHAVSQAQETYSDLQGIVAVNDATAVGAIRALKDQKIEVPRDVAVVGFDNVRWGTINDPPLTTVEMFMREMGVQAARRLVDVIERDVENSFHLRLGTKLIIRRSCGN